MKENIEEDIKIVEKLIKTMEQDRITFKDEQTKEIYAYFITALEHILSDYKRLQEEFKQVDHECERLEQKELRLEKEVEIAKEALKKQCDIADERNQLLRENQELQKENEELLEIRISAAAHNRIIELEKDNEEFKKLANKTQWISPCYVGQNYISKQKIKDKIEELKEKPLKINANNKYYYETDAYNKIIIQVLQDLLEEKGE